MMKRIVLLALCAVLVSPASADASVALRGRSLQVQAAIDAALWHDTARVQVLTSLCERPSKLRRCTPMSDRMRAALDDALASPISWVQARRVDGPTFLVFAPIAFDGGEATATLAFWERGRMGCFGGYTTNYERRRGLWTWTTQLGWAGCAAAAG